MNTRRVLIGSVGAMVLVWAAVILAWGDAPFALTFDDAWYYFTIARNVAEGAGSTFDGINATNGYHPLWLMLCVPVYAVGLDGMAAARTLLMVQLVAWGAAMTLIADTCARSIDSRSRICESDTVDNSDAQPARWQNAILARNTTLAVAFIALAGNPFIVKVFVNGLESGIAVLTYSALLWIGVRRGRNWISDTSGRWRLGTGILLALTFLARTDAVLAIAALGLWCIAEIWSLRTRPPREHHLRALLELFGPAAVTIIAYLIFNQVRFGTAVQISGLVKRAHPSTSMFIGLAICALIAVAIGRAAFRRAGRSPRKVPSRFERTGNLAARTGWFASFCVIIVGYYSFAQVQQWLWYYAPLVLYLILLGIVGVADFIESAVTEASPDRTVGKTLAPVIVILLTPLAVGLVLQTRSFADPNLRSIQVANRNAGEWISSELPDDAVLASWDAGVVGYFSHRSVVNLDGVVNSLEYDRARRSGATGEFLADRRVGWIVNHGYPTDGQDEDILRFADKAFGQGTGDGMTLVQSWPFTYSGSTGGSGFDEERGSGEMAVFLYRLPTPPAPPN